MPPEPKSTVAWALSPAPVTSTTVPSPKASWLTRSPTSTEMTARLPRPPRRPPVDSPVAATRACADAVAGGAGRRLEPRPVHGVGGQLVEEPGRRVVGRLPPAGAHLRPGEEQPLLRPRDADVGQPPLLLQLARVAQRPQVREDAVLERGQEDDGELQALGGVQRHHRDDARVVAA